MHYYAHLVVIKSCVWQFDHIVAPKPYTDNEPKYAEQSIRYLLRMNANSGLCQSYNI